MERVNFWVITDTFLWLSLRSSKQILEGNKLNILFLHVGFHECSPYVLKKLGHDL